MVIQESAEMYLETILVLSQDTKKVRSIDISRYMNFSKPSVSRAVGLLKDKHFIEVDKDGYITLTVSGKEIAETIYERHQFLLNFFVSLGIEKSTASDDACKIEHVISSESFKAVKEFIEKAQKNNQA